MLTAAALLLLLALGIAWAAMIRMPGTSARGPLPPLSPEETAIRDRLRTDLQTLAGDIGERNLPHPDAYEKAATWIEGELGDMGYSVHRQVFTVRAHEVRNIVAELRGATKPEEIVLVGAHYDSVEGTPGANDNGSGVVANLALARAFAGHPLDRTVRFVFFANEEPPYFKTVEMGSYAYAAGCKERHENVVAMLSLETMGYFTDAPHTQHYPKPFSLLYPSTGNFIGFVSNVTSGSLARRAIKAFRASATIPSEGAAVPGFIPGIDWSDQWAFWDDGVPAIMITDTAPFRYPHYHEPTDTPEKVDYDRLARVTRGLEGVVRYLGAT